MKRIINQVLFLGLILTFALFGCKKNFLDTNNDPNRVTDANITPELLFTQAEVAVGDGGRFPVEFIQSWIGYMAANGDFARNPTETSYNIDFSFGNALFLNAYNTLFDLHQAEVKGLSQNDTAITGASMILSAKMFQELVDLFGDIPYSQAFKNELTTRPAYDKAQDIYKSLLLRLDTAIQYMSQTPSSKFAPADVINGGDQTKWIKFANTLKLRLLIRQSEIPGFNPASEIAKIINKGGVIEAGESIAVNPGYVNDVNKQSPFYGQYGYTPTGVKANTSMTANVYIINILKNNNDPRISRFFTTIGGNFVGSRFGDAPGNNPSAAAASYFGPGVVNSATQNQWIYPAFESLFLKAEAIARGWLPGNAQQTYNEAVTESFRFLGVPNAVSAAATYLATSNIAMWSNAGTTVASQVRFIAFQKYIANTLIDPLESYSDLRRLKFLKDMSYISADPAKVSNTLPLRLLYPQSEYTTNSENVLNQGSINAFTTKIFWIP